MKKVNSYIQREMNIKALRMVNYFGEYYNDYEEKIEEDTKIILFRENKKFKIIMLENDMGMTLTRFNESNDFEEINRLFNMLNNKYEYEFNRRVNCYDGYIYTPMERENINIKLKYCLVENIELTIG